MLWLSGFASPNRGMTAQTWVGLKARILYGSVDCFIVIVDTPTKTRDGSYCNVLAGNSSSLSGQGRWVGATFCLRHPGILPQHLDHVTCRDQLWESGRKSEREYVLRTICTPPGPICSESRSRGDSPDGTRAVERKMLRKLSAKGWVLAVRNELPAHWTGLSSL